MALLVFMIRLPFGASLGTLVEAEHGRPAAAHSLRVLLESPRRYTARESAAAPNLAREYARLPTCTKALSLSRGSHREEHEGHEESGWCGPGWWGQALATPKAPPRDPPKGPPPRDRPWPPPLATEGTASRRHHPVADRPAGPRRRQGSALRLDLVGERPQRAATTWTGSLRVNGGGPSARPTVRNEEQRCDPRPDDAGTPTI
jgi:hypothetical protein